LKKRIEDRGGIAYKFISPGRDSVPDRICILPGFVVFVECKGEGNKPTPKQHRELTRLGKLKMNVFVVDTKAGVDNLMERIEPYVDDGKSSPVSEKSDS
jgi:hypothetical protein